MTTTNAEYAGIDYGLGQSNIDLETGIRYGVISANEVGSAWFEESTANYGEPSCPKCGNDAVIIPSHSEQHANGVTVYQDIPEAYEEYEIDGCGDYACESCEYLFDGDNAFGDEPQSFSFDGEGILAEQSGDDHDIFILKSPYYTHAQFCSPCAPGAGYLLNPCADGPKTYCLPHSWFESGVAPYPVFSVDGDMPFNTGGKS